MIRKVAIAYNNEIEVPPELQSIIEHIKTQYEVDIEIVDYRETVYEVSEFTLTLLYLDDIKIKTFLKNHLNTAIKIGFIPNDHCIRAMGSYGISKDVYIAIEEAMNENNISCVDVLTCNCEVVFTNVVIGDVHGLNYKNIENQSIFAKMKNFYLNLKNLGFKDYTLTTAKGQSVQTAATGVMIVEHNATSGKYNIINEELSLHDGKLNAFIISPTSIFSYIYYLLVVTFYAKLNPNTLPKTLGFIKTSKLDIGSSKPMDFMIDGILMSSKEIALEVFKDTLTLSIGTSVIQSLQDNTKLEEDKEIIKTKHLPKGEVGALLLKEAVPLFKKANEDDFKELFISLKDNSQHSSIFIVLMILSTLLATTGLFQNSAPVIIGAMILAPLMSPIISLSMGVVRGESFLITNSLKTLMFGIITALIFSSVYTYLIPLNVLTDEMRGRLNPNLLDLMVAIISGIAGAYANSKSEIAKSLAGVAIAVALVPPLSVAGIGLGWGDFDVTYGSFLLFSTNLVGITLSAAITFLVLGYSPIRRAKKGIIYTSAILVLVSIPLVISFSKAINQNNITRKLNNYAFMENSKTITIHVLHVDLSKNKPEIFLQTSSNDVLDKLDLNLLKQDIEDRLKQSVVLNISTNTIIQ
ncbi:TIGR00341 family protein [Candidatus Sulfurimonas marisnigri]|uniref:TIGR00341 family protein n=1 Tax=Candidatus Sulfurimonas marisnigri TaxID=2740405 RepID=A0A7S7M2Y3_9BACT|nr:TIGR00341 family protein [Candidatus Sulfurimonas marisnigri]QOY55474.1 TIGR00341 family protein [Candidatus Sulfurimonas marisnigri]